MIYFLYMERGGEMSIKDIIDQEKEELQSVKRPYETAAFIIFAVLFIQQLAYWIRGIIQLIDTGWMSLNLPGTPAFVIRIINIDTSSWLWTILGLLGLVLWYFLIYLLVWNYCKKNGYAKWVWTALIVFGPGTILLVPTYLIYAIYVFRPYVFRFIKKGVEEYKSFNPNNKFKEEKEEVKPEPKNEPKPEPVKEQVEEVEEEERI